MSDGGRREIVTIDVESVTFNKMPTGEWEIEVNRDGENLYHYTNAPDGIYDQMIDDGIVEPPLFEDG